jgi:simple sugar transport system permease protein
MTDRSVLRRAALFEADSRLLWPLAAFLLLLAFNVVFSPRFLTLRIEDGRLYGGLIDMLENAAPLVLIACGMAFVIGTGGIDLSVGATMAIAGTVMAALFVRPAYSPLAEVGVAEGAATAILVGVAAATVVGLANGVLIGCLGVQPLMATLAILVAGRGIAQLLSAGQVTTFHDETLELLGSGAFAGIPIPAWLGLAGVVLSLALVRLTALGYFAEAIGDNRTAAMLSGVPLRTVTLIAYVWTGLLAGVAGILTACDIGAADSLRAGRDVELDAILAAVVGGTALTGGRFSIIGAVLGALLIQTLTVTILTQGIAEDVARIAKGSAVLGLCLLQSARFRGLITRSFVRQGRLRA